MDSKDIAEYLDQERWLMNSGLLTDSAKNQLFFSGSIVHKDVQALELDISPEKKLVSYKVFVPSGLLKKINRYKDLSTKKDLISLWLFRRLLKKEGNLNFQGILNKFVKDFCGAKWSVEVDIRDYKDFQEGSSEDVRDGWSIDQLPDTR